jgi:hypothetical protein
VAATESLVFSLAVALVLVGVALEAATAVGMGVAAVVTVKAAGWVAAAVGMEAAMDLFEATIPHTLIVMSVPFGTRVSRAMDGEERMRVPLRVTGNS